MKQLIDDALRLIERGWAPYDGPVEDQVWQDRDCPAYSAPAKDAHERRRRAHAKARWFAKDGRRMCLGCARRCATTDEGFQAVLPVRLFPGKMAFGSMPSLSVDEILKKKRLLRADEAAWCLGVSTRTIYEMAAVGKLVRHVSDPFRVTVESVREELGRVDE